MASVLTIISLVLYFGGILALIIWLVVRTNRKDKEFRVFVEDLKNYLECLRADTSNMAKWFSKFEDEEYEQSRED